MVTSISGRRIGWPRLLAANVQWQRMNGYDVPVFAAGSGCNRAPGGRLTQLQDSEISLAMIRCSPMVSSSSVPVAFGVAHGPPRQLEVFSAFVARDLPGRALSSHFGYREGLVQPDQPQDRPPDQVPQGRRRDR